MAGFYKIKTVSNYIKISTVVDKVKKNFFYNYTL